MNDRDRTTTLRLRTPTAAPVTGPPRGFVAGGHRTSMEIRRSPLQTYVPRRADPISEAILDELAALGLAEKDERD